MIDEAQLNAVILELLRRLHDLEHRVDDLETKTEGENNR
jgi:hypothetical protein